MSSDQTRRSQTAEEGPASSSIVPRNLASSDVACLNAALTLYKETGRSEFLKLAQDVTGRRLATPRGREGNEKATAAMKTIRRIFEIDGDYMGDNEAKEVAEAYQTLWPGDAFIKLDRKVICTIANARYAAKGRIPPSYFRAFLIAFCELAEENPDYRIDEYFNSTYLTEVYEMIDDAFANAQAVLGSCQGSESRLLGAGEYEIGKKMSGQILGQIKQISDSITADADKIIESEKEAFQGLESLVSQVCKSTEPHGNDSSNVLREICEFSMSRSCESLETLKAKAQAMSKFLEGSIEIFRDSSDSSN